MILDKYFVNTCKVRYKLTEKQLYKMLRDQDDRCYICHRFFHFPKNIYLDYDILRKKSFGLTCKRCFNDQRERYENELNDIHNKIKNFIPQSHNIIEVEFNLFTASDLLQEMLKKIDINYKQIKDYIDLTLLTG